MCACVYVCMCACVCGKNCLKVRVMIIMHALQTVITILLLLLQYRPLDFSSACTEVLSTDVYRYAYDCMRVGI